MASFRIIISNHPFQDPLLRSYFSGQFIIRFKPLYNLDFLSLFFMHRLRVPFSCFYLSGFLGVWGGYQTGGIYKKTGKGAVLGFGVGGLLMKSLFLSGCSRVGGRTVPYPWMCARRGCGAGGGDYM